MKITDFISFEDLEYFVQEFSQVHNVVVTITDTEGIPICKYLNYSDACKNFHRNSKEGLKRCILSDATLGKSAAKADNLVINRCGCGGFIDAAFPIKIEGEHIATVLTGQVLFKKPNKEEYKKVADELDIQDFDEYWKAVNKIQVVDQEYFKKINHIFRLFIEQVIKSAYAEYKNKRLAEYYKLIFYHLPNPTSLNDTKGNRLEFSKSTEDLYKYNQEELLKLPLNQVYSENDTIKIQDAIVKCMNNQKSQVETIAFRKNNTSFPVLLTFSPVVDYNNNVINLLISATDISELKEREKEYEFVIDESIHTMKQISNGNYNIRINTNYKHDDLKLLTETINIVIEYLNKADDDLKLLIKDLATPAIEVLNGVVVMPLIGKLTSDRALDAMESILNKIEVTKAKVGIIDITGVSNVDSVVADSLIKAIDAIKIIGAFPILSGVSAPIAINFVRLGIKFDFITINSLSDALKYAKKIIKNSN